VLGESLGKLLEESKLALINVKPKKDSLNWQDNSVIPVRELSEDVFNRLMYLSNRRKLAYEGGKDEGTTRKG